MMQKQLQMPFEVKSVDETGVFSGYGSVFGVVDSYRDVVQKGAFVQSLRRWQEKGRLPPVLWQHDRSQPIGVFTKMVEDERGLYVEGRLLADDVPQAKSALALLKAGALGGLSIGYREVAAEFDAETKTSRVQEVDLWEVSVVTFPANEAATVDSVKSGLAEGRLPTLAEFEKFLREAGFSKSQATCVASHGLRVLLREAADVNDADFDDVKQAIAILKGL